MYLYPCKPNTLTPDSKLFDELDRDIGWIAEVKKNGWRALPTKSEDGSLTIWTRHKTLIKDAVPELREALANMMPNGTILDGEFINNRTKGVKGKLYLFDIIMLEGKSLIDMPLRERRKMLEGVVVEGPHIELAQQIRVGKKQLYYQSIEGEENEGIVIKRLDSKYLASEKSCPQNPYWLKVKRVEKHIKVGKES
ncbi:MAG: RNA ligase family protein [Nitrospirota bacterium]